jgi:hypothetical protein
MIRIFPVGFFRTVVRIRSNCRPGCKEEIWFGEDVKLLFFSSDRSEVQVVWSALHGAGIQCEVRSGRVPKRICPSDGGMELWIEKDRDYHRASILCAELGVGFWKHPVKPPGIGAEG